MKRSEIRKDYIQEKYVIIAPLRGKRPHDVLPDEGRKKQSQKSCVFCPDHKDHPKESLYCFSDDEGGLCSPDGDWEIKVIPNQFPAVSLDNPKAYGQQEVVIETKDHGVSLSELPKKHIANLFLVYKERSEEIIKNDKIEYVIIFKNQGGRAGASLSHAHSQIFATDFIPPHLIDKSQRMQRYKLENGSCVYCDVFAKEQNGPRLVYKDSYIIAFCPYAPIHNYELWIMPLRHIDNITLLNDNERLSWAEVLKRMLPKISKLGLAYNFYFHQVVNDEDQHLYMKVTPRGSMWAGVEIGSGVVINPIPPEVSAMYYRNE